MTYLTVFCILEQSAGIIAACIPACVPIFRRGRAKDSQNRLLSTRQNYYELSHEYSAQRKPSSQVSYATTAGEEEAIGVDPGIQGVKSAQ